MAFAVYFVTSFSKNISISSSSSSSLSSLLSISWNWHHFAFRTSMLCQKYWFGSAAWRLSRLPLMHRGVVVTTIAQLHSTNPELRFCAGSNPAGGVSEICDGEDPWQWSRLEMRLNSFCWSTIPQKQFITITIIIIIMQTLHRNPYSLINTPLGLLGSNKYTHGLF